MAVFDVANLLVVLYLVGARLLVVLWIDPAIRKRFLGMINFVVTDKASFVDIPLSTTLILTFKGRRLLCPCLFSFGFVLSLYLF